MSNSPISNNEIISDEATVIKQYKTLINKLIPFQHENKLLEGLNRFSSKLPSRVRAILKDEVIRLTSLTDASADNSEFAKFPVLKFKHFGIPMRLDKVGQELLKRETERFHERYTVGVFESIMSSDHYQSHVKQEQQKKIVDAFKVEYQSFKDIDFGQDLALRPNFTVFCLEFDKGKQCSLASLSDTGMTVETKRTPVIECEGNMFTFTFPAIAGFSEKSMDIKFEKIGSNFNKAMSVFETQFRLAPGSHRKLTERLKKYVDAKVNQFPLQRDLEIERVMQNLERDRILSNSPWIPVFIGENKGELTPLFQLMTPTNADYNQGFSPLEDLPTKQIFQNLIKELLTHKETFLLKGEFESPKGNISVAITHRQLARTNLMKQFIERATQSDKFNVLQFRLQTVLPDHKSVAFDIHDLIANDLPELESINHILFCKDVTTWIGNLKIAKPEAFKPFPKGIIDDKTRWPIKVVMEDQSDRRVQPRYTMDIPASVKPRVFSQIDGKLNDLSVGGLKLTLANNTEKFEKNSLIKVSIKTLKLSNQKYQVVAYNESSRVLRLKVPAELTKSQEQKLQGVLNNNIEYFKQRNLDHKKRHTYRFLWELSIRNLPCVSVLTTNNRFTIDRLKTVYHKEDGKDLEPFTVLGNEIPLHGFFSDKEATKPKSSLLDNMLRNSQRDAHVVHLVRVKDKKIIFVPEEEFLFGDIRNKVSGLVNNESVEANITHLSAIRCTNPTTPLTSKRLAQISKIDKGIYDKLCSMQKGYTHVIYINNVSIFHNALLKFGIYPEEEKDKKEIIEN